MPSHEVRRIGDAWHVIERTGGIPWMIAECPVSSDAHRIAAALEIAAAAGLGPERPEPAAYRDSDGPIAAAHAALGGTFGGPDDDDDDAEERFHADMAGLGLKVAAEVDLAEWDTRIGLGPGA